MSSRRELFYCGFDSHLPFTKSVDTPLIPLNLLRWSALQHAGDTNIDKAWLGWCTLFVRTKDNRVFLFNYDSPDKLPGAILCKFDQELTVEKAEWSSQQTFAVGSDGMLRRWPDNVVQQLPNIVPELCDENAKVAQVISMI